MAPPKTNDQSPRSSTDVTDDSSPLASAIIASPVVAAASDNERNPDLFRLLDLPPELVIRVLEYAVTISNKSKPLRISNEEPTAVQPAITQACRLLRFEGLKVFYEKNLFEADTSEGGLEALSKWVESVGEQKRTMIERLNVIWCLQDGSGRSGVVDGEFDVCRYDFWSVTKRMAQDACLPPGVYIRMESDKVILASNTSEDIFSISFRDYSGDPSRWQALEDIADAYFDHASWDDAMGNRAYAADFWQLEVDG